MLGKCEKGNLIDSSPLFLAFDVVKMGMKKIVLFFADFEPIMCNEKRGFTASQEIGQTTFVLKKGNTIDCPKNIRCFKSHAPKG